MNGKKSTAGNSVLSVFTGNTGIIGVLVILCVVVALATDKFLTPSNIISVLRQISINTYIALGMTLIIILGHIDLAVGAIVAMSGTLTTSSGDPANSSQWHMHLARHITVLTTIWSMPRWM